MDKIKTEKIEAFREHISAVDSNITLLWKMSDEIVWKKSGKGFISWTNERVELVLSFNVRNVFPPLLVVES